MALKLNNKSGAKIARAVSALTDPLLDGLTFVLREGGPNEKQPTLFFSADLGNYKEDLGHNFDHYQNYPTTLTVIDKIKPLERF